MLTHNFKIINDPSQWDGDMKNFFNSLAEYWLSMHPKPNRRWREEYAMKLYKQLNGDFIEILARWKIYFSNYCIECGRQLEGDLKYCPWCGMDRSMDSAVDEMIEKPDSHLFGREHNGEVSETDKLLTKAEQDDDMTEESHIDDIPKDEESFYRTMEEADPLQAEEVVMKKEPDVLEEMKRNEEPLRFSEAQNVEDPDAIKPGYHQAQKESAGLEGMQMTRQAEEAADSAGLEESGEVSLNRIPLDMEKHPADEHAATGRMQEERFVVSPVNDKEYRDQKFIDEVLGDNKRDLSRYENLARRDSLGAMIARNEEVMRSAGYTRDNYEAEKQNLAQRSSELKDQMTGLQSQKQALEAAGATDTAQYQEVAGTLTSTARSYSETVYKLQSLENAKQADISNVAYHREYEKCNRNERNFAQINTFGGGSGRTYESAAAYKHNQQVEAIRKEKITYHNFDSNQYRGLLTPEEEARYRMERDTNRYRDAAIGMGAKTAVSIAKGTVATTAAIAGSFAASYGGATTSIGIGVMSARGANAVMKQIGNAAGAVPDTVAAGAKLAKERVNAAYEKDRVIYSASPEEKTAKKAGLGSVYARADEMAKQGGKKAASLREEKEKNLGREGRIQ